MKFTEEMEEAIENYDNSFRKLTAVERKENILEQWNRTNECCVTCKHWKFETCEKNDFTVLEVEARKYTCEKHTYESMD